MLRVLQTYAVFLVAAAASGFTLWQVGEGQTGKNEPPQNSADDQLSAADFPVFQKGKSIADIQQQLRWRGRLNLSARRDGVPISAVDFGIAGGFLSKQGKNVWAILIDDKFEKFVDWPDASPSRQVDDFSYLFAAADAAPLDVAAEEKKRLAIFVPGSDNVDPGLTAVVLIFSGPLLVRGSRDKKVNLPLRDQFNAQRLRLGMTVEECERILRAKPLAKGRYPAGTVLIYGSEIDVDLGQSINYSNILLLVKDGRIEGIRSGWKVPGGSKWRDTVSQSFGDVKFED